jgi:uncharacterized protein YvpB
VFVAAIQVVGTFGAASGVGGWVAAEQQHQGVSAVQADLAAADGDFQRQVRQSLQDGTAAASLAELQAREGRIMRQPQPQPRFFVDRSVILAVGDRVAGVRRLTVDAQLREIDAELALNHTLRDLLARMSQDLAAAKDAGLDTTDFDSFYQLALGAADREQIPRIAQKTLDDTGAKDDALKSATAARVAANQAAAAAAAAFQAARDNALYQRGRALSDLARAQAIPTLDLHDVAAAIADLETRFPGARSIDDFNAFAAGYSADARTLETLLYTRSNAYNLLGSARAALGRAQQAGADVSADAAHLQDLAGQLDLASNLSAIQAVAGQLSFVLRDLEGLYFEARSRPFQPAGAIIANVPFTRQIYSLSCEAASLQMALAYYGIGASQDTILGVIGVDRTPPYYDGSGTLHWGDPYQGFVGDPNGYENAGSGAASGYGTYYSTIARAATTLGGHVAQAGEGIPPSVIYAAAHNRQPVVAWVAFAYQPHPMHYMIAFDGRTVMYGAPWEHAVTISGWAPGYLLINNPHSHPEWVDAGTFEAAYGMFDNMAVVLTSAPPPPPPPPPPASPPPSPGP